MAFVFRRRESATACIPVDQNGEIRVHPGCRQVSKSNLVLNVFHLAVSCWFQVVDFLMNAVYLKSCFVLKKDVGYPFWFKERVYD